MDALELADELDAYHTRPIHRLAAAELRRLAALEKDALRYRWLKLRLYRGNVDVAEAYITMKVVGSCPEPAEIDAAIDAAMERK